MSVLFGNHIANNEEIQTTALVADDHEIILRTNGMDRIYIDVDGNMAIGQQQSDFDNSDQLLIYNESQPVIRFKNSSTSSGTRMGLEPNSGGFIINNLEDAEIKFLTNGTNRVVITNEGNVNIGNETGENAKLFICESSETTAPSFIIQQEGTLGDCSMKYFIDGSNAWTTGIDRSDGNKFKINNASNLSTSSEFVIDLNGNIGIGTNSPIAMLEVTGDLIVDTGITSLEDISASLDLWVGNEVNIGVTENRELLTVGGNCILTRSIFTQGLTRSLTIEGARSAIASDIAEINFDNLDNDDATVNYTASQICVENGSVGNSGSIKFVTNNGTSLVLGLMIDNNQNVLINTTVADERLTLVGDAGKTIGGTVWNDNSDERIKENIVNRDTKSSLESINKLKLREYDYTSDYIEENNLPDKHRIGLIAQELELTHPNAVITSDKPRTIGNLLIEDFKKINMSQINYEIIGAIQELDKKLNSLLNM